MQWLRTFFLPKIKLKGAERQSYAIDHAEPSLYFSLCTGCHSDPVVKTGLLQCVRTNFYSFICETLLCFFLQFIYRYAYTLLKEYSKS